VQVEQQSCGHGQLDLTKRNALVEVDAQHEVHLSKTASDIWATPSLLLAPSCAPMIPGSVAVAR
jgi:hypothetical protein